MGQGSFFLFDLVVLLIVASVGGYLARKISQPTILGQIIAGVIVGPAVLGIVQNTEVVASFAEVGVILLMFIAGLETDVEDLKASGKASLLIAFGGVVMPVLMAVATLNFIKPDAMMSEKIFVGVILTATSVSVTVQVLRELKQLQSKVGVAILGAAIIDDVLGILMVTVVVGMVQPEANAGIFQTIIQIIGFFVFTALVGIAFVRLMKKHHSRLSSGNRILSFALIFCFVLSVIAEKLGVSAVIGAYFTGIVFSSTTYRNRVSKEVQKLGYALFIPIFFAHIGLSVRFSGVKEGVILSLAMIVIAVLSKIIGCWIGAKACHFSAKESLQVGIGMIPRAEVALIVTNLGVKLGILGQDILNASILVVLASTLITPVILKASFKGVRTE